MSQVVLQVRAGVEEDLGNSVDQLIWALGTCTHTRSDRSDGPSSWQRELGRDGGVCDSGLRKGSARFAEQGRGL